VFDSSLEQNAIVTRRPTPFKGGDAPTNERTMTAHEPLVGADRFDDVKTLAGLPVKHTPTPSTATSKHPSPEMRTR
jgi:hypothetical protein